VKKQPNILPLDLNWVQTLSLNVFLIYSRYAAHSVLNLRDFGIEKAISSDSINAACVSGLFNVILHTTPSISTFLYSQNLLLKSSALCSLHNIQNIPAKAKVYINN
jgi:hypothetical protein